MSSLQQRRHGASMAWDQWGLPSSKLEAWRHTRLRPLDVDAQPCDGGDASPAPLDGCDGRVVLVDGVLDARATTLPEGVEVWPIERCEDDRIGAVARHDRAEDALTARNLARFDRGFVLKVAPQTVVGVVEVSCLYRTPPAEMELRGLVVVGKSASMTLVERHVGLVAGAHWVTQVVEVSVEPNASLQHVWVQRHNDRAVHLSKVWADVQRDGRYHGQVVQLGGALSRSDVEVALSGAGAWCYVDGVYHGLDRQHLDNHSVIHHLADHTESGEHYRGVLDGQSTGIFRGNVLIHEGARGCSTAQINRNLLLSEGATVHTKPQLEIDNDDVTASHGATIGQLDEQALFYLRSRGIDATTAKRLMVFAFVAEVISKVPVESLRSELYELLARRLGEDESWSDVS